MTPVDRQRIEQILDGFHGKTILVIGDVILDQFTWGRVRRISPEAPVPVVEVIEETDGLGGSANAAANIRSLDGRPITIGVIGRDQAADRLIALFDQLDIDSSHLVPDDRRTTLKTRIIAHGQQVVRTDREDRTPLSPETNDALKDRFMDALPHADAVVVSDYDKSVVNAELLGFILPEARKADVPVFLDPKVHHADYYRPTTLIKPNNREAELLTGMVLTDRTSLEEAGKRLLDRFECPYILITRGEDGMSLFDRDEVHHLQTAAREVFDVTGAGDTVIACLAMAAAGGARMDEAALLANHAAGLVVGKVGTASVSRQELLDDLEGLLDDFSNTDAHPAG